MGWLGCATGRYPLTALFAGHTFQQQVAPDPPTQNPFAVQGSQPSVTEGLRDVDRSNSSLFSIKRTRKRKNCA